MAFVEVFTGHYLNRNFITHRRRVQNLFKRIARNEEAYFHDQNDIKFAWATVRAEFEKHRNVRDLRTAKLLLEEGERKLFQHLHPVPKRFIFSPGGICWHRDYNFPDVLLDSWHPLEKAQFPYYFEKREQLKKEYIKYWEKNYGGKSDSANSH